MTRAGVGAGIRWGSGQGVCGGRGGLSPDKLRFAQHVGSSPSASPLLWLPGLGPAENGCRIVAGKALKRRLSQQKWKPSGRRSGQAAHLRNEHIERLQFRGLRDPVEQAPSRDSASDCRLVASRATERQQRMSDHKALGVFDPQGQCPLLLFCLYCLCLSWIATFLVTQASRATAPSKSQTQLKQPGSEPATFTCGLLTCGGAIVPLTRTHLSRPSCQIPRLCPWRIHGSL